MVRHTVNPKPRERRGSLLDRSIALLVALVMAASFWGMPTAFAADTATAETDAARETSQEPIVIVHTNDVHCAVDDNLGYAGLSSYVDTMEETCGKENVTLVDAGDAVQGNVIGTLSQGEYLVEIMNQVGYDIAVPGNHEFDYGMTQLQTLMALSNAKYLSCNLTDLRTGNTVFDPYQIIEYGEGDGATKVAYVGICTPETLTKSSPSTFQDENGEYLYSLCQDDSGEALYDVVQDSVDAARSEGADYVVAVAHLGQAGISEQWTSEAVVQNTDGIDALIDGHSHEVYVQDDVRNKNGENVTVVQTGYALQNIGTVTIDPSTGEVDAALVSAWDEKDAETQALIDDVNARIQETAGQVIGTSDVKLTAVEDDGWTWAVRHRETNLGDFVADAYLATARRQGLDADVAFINGGGLRADVNPGEVTYGDLINVNPYSNQVVMVEATGQQILDALEVGAGGLPEPSGGFLQVAGMSYTVRTDIPSTVVVDESGFFQGVSGEYRVRDVKVNGEPLDLERTYGLVSIEYLLQESGDGMTMFLDAEPTLVSLDSEALIDYITTDLGGTIGQDYANDAGQGRIVVQEGDDPCSAFSDIDRNAWYHDAIEWALENEVLHGIGGTDLMMPDGSLTRAQMATVLHNIAGNPSADLSVLDGFSDVDKTAWYAQAVAWAVSASQLEGFGGLGAFGPDEVLSREQAAVVLMRWQELQGADVTARADLSAFADADECASWAQEAMSWAVASGAVQGVEQVDGTCTLDPQGDVTRAQMATLLMRLAETA